MQIKELDIRICPTLKRMTRVIEKARLKGRNSAACVKDGDRLIPVRVRLVTHTACAM